MKIGIGVTTTPNRQHVFEQWFAAYSKVSLPGFHLYIHNDANYQGIAYSKNKCLSALYEAGCTDIFLFDDDTLINNANWHVSYICSGLNHACWNFNRKLKNPYILTDVRSYPVNYKEYEKPNGCMLYVKREVLDIVGGFDEDFKIWGYEHVNWSDRIFNNGLTPARYIDVAGSKGLFQMVNCETSVSNEIRERTIPINEKLYKEKFYSKEFKPFK